MLQNRVFKQFEFVLIYIVLPLLFVFDIFSAKFLLPVLWLMLFYTLFILKVTKSKFSFKVFDKTEIKPLLIRFLFLGTIFMVLSFFYSPEAFFHLVLDETKLFIFLLLFYPFLSVIPQEVVYRLFFFSRYTFLFSKEKQTVLNALLFSFAHTLFGSAIVLLLTLFIGIIFAKTYLKSGSFVIVCIEHTLYGYLLFTSGIGELFFQEGTLDTIRGILY